MNGKVVLDVTVQPVGAKWSGAVRRDDSSLMAAFDTREETVSWVVGRVADALRPVSAVDPWEAA